MHFFTYMELWAVFKGLWSSLSWLKLDLWPQSGTRCDLTRCDKGQKKSCQRHPSAASSCHIQCHLLPFPINLKQIVLSFKFQNSSALLKAIDFWTPLPPFYMKPASELMLPKHLFHSGMVPRSTYRWLVWATSAPQFRCWALPHYVNSTSYNSCCSPHKWVTAAKCIFRSCSVVLM